MAKKETAVNSKGEEGKVLQPVNEAPAAPVPAVGTEGKRKKNMAISVEYLNKEGKPIENGEAIEGLKVTTKEGSKIVELAKLSNSILRTAAAFGLNTTLRNAHNSAANAGADGIAALNGRLTSILNGEWRAVGEGDDGVPLVIEAMIRAKKDGKAYVENMEEQWLTTYRGLTKEGKAEWTKTMSAKKPIAIALLQIKAERAAAKAAKAIAGGDNAPEAGDDF